MVNMAIVVAMGGEQSNVPHLLSQGVDSSPAVPFRETFDASVVHALEETKGWVIASVAQCQESSVVQPQVGTAMETAEGKDAASVQVENAVMASMRPQTALSRERYTMMAEGQTQAAATEEAAGATQQEVAVPDGEQLSAERKPSTNQEEGEHVAAADEGNTLEQASSPAISDGRTETSEETKDSVRSNAGSEGSRRNEISDSVSEADNGHRNDKALKDEPKIKRHKSQLSRTSNAPLKTVQKKSPQESSASSSFAMQPMQCVDQTRPSLPSSEQVKPETNDCAGEIVPMTHHATAAAGGKYQIGKMPVGLRERTSTADETVEEAPSQHVETQSQARPSGGMTKVSGELPYVALPDKTVALHGRRVEEGHVLSSLSSPLTERFHVPSGPETDKGSVVHGSLPSMIAHAERGLIEPRVTIGGNRALVANSTTLEVGLPGGPHGWLKVRAELASDGTVHASISSTSQAGAEMLRRELPSLTTYLHQEQVPVNSVVVHANGTRQDPSATAGGPDQSGTGGSRHGGAQQNRNGPEATAFVDARERARKEIAEDGSAGWLPQSAPTISRGWLSVRA